MDVIFYSAAGKASKEEKRTRNEMLRENTA